MMSLGKGHDKPKKHPGRAPISGPGETRIPRGYKFPPGTIAKIDALSAATGLSNTEVIVRAIDRTEPEDLQPEPA